MVAPVFFARSWLVAPMAQPAAKCSAPQHRVSCPKRARGCGAWVDWFTAHSVHSSQFTSHGYTRRLHAFLSRPRRCSRKDQPSPKTSFAFGRCYPRPTAAVDGATQVVLSCLSAERTSEYYSNGCSRLAPPKVHRRSRLCNSKSVSLLPSRLSGPPNTTATDVFAFGTSQGPSPQPIVQ